MKQTLPLTSSSISPAPVWCLLSATRPMSTYTAVFSRCTSDTWPHSTTRICSCTKRFAHQCRPRIPGYNTLSRIRLSPSKWYCTLCPACPSCPSCDWLDRSPATCPCRRGLRASEFWLSRLPGWSLPRRCWRSPWRRHRSDPSTVHRFPGRKVSPASTSALYRSRTSHGSDTSIAYSA